MPAERIKLVGRWLLRGVRLAGCLTLIYAGYLLVGLIPVNRDYVPPATGTLIYVVSSSVHADLVLPIRHDRWDWSNYFPPDDFRVEPIGATHVAIGWGDRGFYLETPTWNDLKASTALRAMLWPSNSVMHVTCTTPPKPGPTAGRIQLDDESYEQLCRSVLRGFAGHESGGPRQIAGYAYGLNDAFYEARGVYHCFNTCNSWVGRRLAEVGAPTPLFTPLPRTPLLYLPAE